MRHQQELAPPPRGMFPQDSPRQLTGARSRGQKRSGHAHGGGHAERSDLVLELLVGAATNKVRGHDQDPPDALARKLRDGLTNARGLDLLGAQPLSNARTHAGRGKREPAFRREGAQRLDHRQDVAAIRLPVRRPIACEHQTQGSQGQPPLRRDGLALHRVALFLRPGQAHPHGRGWATASLLWGHVLTGHARHTPWARLGGDYLNLRYERKRLAAIGRRPRSRVTTRIVRNARGSRWRTSMS